MVKYSPVVKGHRRRPPQLLPSTTEHRDDRYSPKPPDINPGQQQLLPSTTKHRDDRYSSEPPDISPECAVCLGFTILLILIFLVVRYAPHGLHLTGLTAGGMQPPNFRVEHVAVSLNSYGNSSTQVATEWNIAFTVHNPHVNMDIQDFSVSVMSLTGSSSVVVLPGFRHHYELSRVMLKATLRGALPSFDTANTAVLQFNVDFETRFKLFTWARMGRQLYTCRAKCKIMQIQLQPYQMQGALLEVPFPCQDQG